MAREALTISALNKISNIENSVIRHTWKSLGVPCRKEEVYDCNLQRYATMLLLTRDDFSEWLASNSHEHRVIRATRRAFGIGD